MIRFMTVRFLMMIDELQIIVFDDTYKTTEYLSCYSTMYKKVLF